MISQEVLSYVKKHDPWLYAAYLQSIKSEKGE